ncbi:hypothetical protein WDW89_11335 [Deltaproteobacteria bacterium TL4]
MKKNRDVLLSRILLAISLMIITYWIGNGLIWLWNWYVSVSESADTGVWEEVGLFIKTNLSVLTLVYGIISLQVSGVAELKFEKNFLVAFALAILLTPPVMMAVYGHKRVP